MKFFAALLALVLALLCTARASPIRHDGRVRVLVNRPSREDMFNEKPRVRTRREDRQAGVKGGPVLKPDPMTMAMTVRKGEYVCGNKICKLQPGQIPKGCVGCQYPIKLPTLAYYNSDYLNL